MKFQCGRFNLDLNTPKIMGIINMTPDSFSDGGDYSSNINKALKYAEDLIQSGADILDIGGESSRPGASYVSAEEEWNRIKGLLKKLKKLNIPISLDTRKTEVMKKALESDCVDMINDIEALSDHGALELLSQYHHIGICLMHMKGKPNSMQNMPQYNNIVSEINSFFEKKIELCNKVNIDRERLILDPGIGFGKTFEHNIDLIRSIPNFLQKFNIPILLGVSRKSLLASITHEEDPKKRLGGSIALAYESLTLGVKILRVHDVFETKQAVLTWQVLN